MPFIDAEAKTTEELEIMREAGRIIAVTLQAMRDEVAPGVSTARLNQIAEECLRDHNATPAFLNYAPGNHPPFPATITACVNEELVHGIPRDDFILNEGDLVSLDVGCFYNGFVGDAAFSMGVGEIHPMTQKLLDITEQALEVAIEASVLGNNISDVCKAIQKFVESKGYSVPREYTGHGIGREMHLPPSVPNWWPRSKKGQKQWQDCRLVEGMTYAIEPMVIAGRPQVEELDDGWTVVTKDGSLCCHCEHSVAITDGKPIILSLL